MPSRRDLANCLRILSADAVQKANSGHPGMPMGMADIAEVLWNDFLKHNPNNPEWSNRDRFVLSNGHGSMLQYALLHLSGYPLDMEAIQHFRQLHSPTPGHPEYGVTPGVETTTGPLGQGFANAVGMAIAEKRLAAEFNTPKQAIVDHYTYVFLGDGCLMEGISHEAASLAGTLGLGKLIAFWDDNGISIDGQVNGWFTDDTPKRFEAYGWHVIADVDGHDREAIAAAIQSAQKETDRPTLICCKTKIGYGSPNLEGSEKTHGAPLGEAELAAVRQQLNWEHGPFEIPEDYYAAWDAKARGAQAEAAWQAIYESYQADNPSLADEFERRMPGDLPVQWQAKNTAFIAGLNEKAATMATRKASLSCIEHHASQLPELVGGSADLSGSNCTHWSGSISLSRDNFTQGNYINYGVREFGMFAIMNGMALHGGFVPYGGTFLVFTDYGRNAIRLAAMMEQRVIFVLTHDSIGLGEDGPTHQPIEHAAILRLTPNLDVWRPCDTVETAVAWACAIKCDHGPTALLLTRQDVPHQARDIQALAHIEQGGYVLWENQADPEVIMIATGSEVALAMEAAQHLATQQVAVRVVSMPCVEAFERQTQDYKDAVLPPAIKARVAVEAGVSDYWRKYVGLDGSVVGIDRFGESAPAEEVFQFLGVHAKAVVEAAQKVMNASKQEV